MGKSEKKIKSDRINALRKKYDAFLEEDKKRKERNDYILTRLDQIRSCTTLAQSRKPNIDPERYYYKKLCIKDQLPDYNSKRTYQLIPANIPTIHTDETLFLKQISSKYILIPKNKQHGNNLILENDFGQPITPEINEKDNNWKTKYEILDKLKQSEKETLDEHGDNLVPKKPDVIFKENVEIIGELDKTKDFAPSSNEYGNLSKSLKSETPERHNITNSLKNEILTYSENLKDNENYSKESKEKEALLTNQELNMTQVKNRNSEQDTESKDNVNYATDHLKQENVEFVSECDTIHNDITETLLENNSVNDSNPTNDNAYTEPIQDNLKEVINELDYKAVINCEEKTRQDESGINKRQTQVSNETINAIGDGKNLENSNIHTESINNSSEIMTENSLTEDSVPSQRDENIHSEGKTIDQSNYDTSYQHDVSEPNVVIANTETPVDNSQIEAFDNEQQEMFYQKDEGENYAYNQDAGYDVEHSVPAENYEHNEEYLYYQGEHQAENYPAEINEHEETSQNYDQNYEQQYGNAYEQSQYAEQTQEYVEQPQQYAEQPQVYDEQSQQYAEQPQEYTQQAEYTHEQNEVNNQAQEYEQEQVDLQVYDQTGELYEQVQYNEENYETHEQVVEQLDHEDGYVQNEELIQQDIQQLDGEAITKT